MAKKFIFFAAIGCLLSGWVAFRNYSETEDIPLLSVLLQDLSMTSSILSKESCYNIYHFMYEVYKKYPQEIIIFGWIGVFLSVCMFTIRVLFKRTIDAAVERAILYRSPQDLRSNSSQLVDAQQKSRITSIENELSRMMALNQQLSKDLETAVNTSNSTCDASNDRLDKILNKLRTWRREWAIVKAMVIASYEVCFPDTLHRLSTSSDSSDFGFANIQH